MSAVGAGRRPARWPAVLVAGSLVAGLVALGASGAGASTPSGPATAVVVMAGPGAEPAAELAVQALGGRVTRPLAIINGFAARLPSGNLPALASTPGVVSVSPDGTVRPMSMVPSLDYDPAADLGSLSRVSQFTGAQSAWAAGLTGAGVDVAVIDTGITPMAGLDAPGKVINGPDLSFDEGSPPIGSPVSETPAPAAIMARRAPFVRDGRHRCRRSAGRARSTWQHGAIRSHHGAGPNRHS